MVLFSSPGIVSLTLKKKLAGPPVQYTVSNEPRLSPSSNAGNTPRTRTKQKISAYIEEASGL
jgi:hypothetical protein